MISNQDLFRKADPEVDIASRDHALGVFDLAIAKRQAAYKLEHYYPETGELARHKYVKHMAFFAAGKDSSERAFVAGNRVGKTEGVGAYETTLHLTGQYPKWWVGKRFGYPITAWAAGDTNTTTRDILQVKLLGADVKGRGGTNGLGTGMIPASTIVNTTPKSGVPNAIETVYVRHVSGGVSTLTFKSYEQGRKTFQGTEIDLIWCDEEPPEDVYDEGSMRTMATGAFLGGIILVTFTPLSGWTKVIERFLNEIERKKSGRYVIQAGWDDAPHLNEAEKADRLRKLPPHQRDARMLGTPQLGSGAIYPVPESEILVPPFAIPHHWPRAYALDVGWKRTAAVWGATDRDTRITYLYAEHYVAHADPGTNARAIQAKGAWIPGVIDPAARGRSQADGEQLIVQYRNLGLNLQPADNAVEAGIQLIWESLVEGSLKVMKTMPNWLSEFRLYRRDDKGRIVKENDHLMDGCVVAETMVLTKDGAIPIVDLVGKTGTVLSRCGAWATFYGARKTIAGAVVVTLSFEDGTRVTCTPDHPFLTPDGWVKAIDMQGRSAYNAVSQSIQSRNLLSGVALQSFLRRQLRCFRERVTTFAGSISSATTARPSFVERLVSTTRNTLAWCVAATLWRIATRKQPHAREHAGTRCLEVVDEGNRADVFCLSVPATSSFCIESGLVVHNTRYLMKSGRNRMICQPPPKMPPPAPRAPSGNRGWMS